MREAKSPKELLDSLPFMEIADRTHIFEEVNKGVFKISDESRQSMPQLEWYQLYNLVKDS